MQSSMVDFATYLGFFAFFAGLPALCLWGVSKGVESGTIYARGHPYRRNSEPIYYWMTIAIYVTLALVIGYYGVLFCIAFWRNG